MMREIKKGVLDKVDDQKLGNEVVVEVIVNKTSGSFISDRSNLFDELVMMCEIGKSLLIFYEILSCVIFAKKTRSKL